jgi:ABC-type Na+ transport system ATPase subunit NatA
MPIVEVHHLVKKYDGFTALEGISFHLEEGEIFGLLAQLPNSAEQFRHFSGSRSP